MNDFKPDYIMIPYPVYIDQRLESVDRVLYGVVYCFEHMRMGKCIASNEKLAIAAGVSARSVPNALTRLEDCGYIKRIYKDKSKRNRTEIKALISFHSIKAIRGSTKGDTRLNESRDTRLNEQSINNVSNKNYIAARNAAKLKAKKKPMPKRNTFGSYREDRSEDEFEDTIDADTGSARQTASAEMPKGEMKELLQWGEAKLGRQFANMGKQRKAISTMLKAGYQPKAIEACWERLAKEKFWQTSGIDFGVVLSQISKKVEVRATNKVYK